MRHVRNRLTICAGITVLSALCGGCGGQDFLARLLKPTVVVRIVNDTSFAAEPELLVSGSRNVIEDAFDTDASLVAVGTNGKLAPKTEAQVLLTCDGKLERIALLGATFRTDFGLKVGDVDDAVNLRRDLNFDCGETVVFTLSGTVGNFKAASKVDKSSPVLPIGATPNAGGSSSNGDIADMLDNLFN